MFYGAFCHAALTGGGSVRAHADVASRTGKRAHARTAAGNNELGNQQELSVFNRITAGKVIMALSARRTRKPIIQGKKGTTEIFNGDVKVAPSWQANAFVFKQYRTAKFCLQQWENEGISVTKEGSITGTVQRTGELQRPTDRS